MTGSTWRRAARCADAGCTEVAEGPDGILLRSSLQPDVVVSLTRGEWDTFVEGVKTGDFDELGSAV